MQSLSLTQIAQITRGKLMGKPEWANRNISLIFTDSRQSHSVGNSLFIALQGPRNNGHDYIPDLVGKGLQYFLISDKATVHPEAFFVLVSDTTKALQQLATFNRHLFSYPVVGITGSNGKTIVKEWLHDLLSPDFRIVRSPKSYNSQIGVPLSVLLMDADDELGIFEAGISMPGEMEKLAPVIDPEIGIFTNIGDAHQEFFDSAEHKIDEKLKLFSSSRKLVCRADNPIVYTKTKAFCTTQNLELLTWSTKDVNCPIYFNVNEQPDHCRIETSHNQKRLRFRIPFTDDSAIENACHCFVALLALELDPEKYLERFSALHPVAMRLEIKQGINNCTLINDFYNSDLNSLAIALAALKQQAAGDRQQKLVILSDIEQSGLPQEKLYSSVNQLLTNWQTDRLIAIGPNLSANKNQITLPTQFFQHTEEFIRQFRAQDFHSLAILLKGARHFQFEKISAVLQQKAHQTVLEINLNALVNNLNNFRQRLNPGTKIMVMVKAFSYGSGDVEVARALQYQQVDYLAVAVADEGIQLRNAGITVPIIVMNPEYDSFQNIIQFNLEPNIYSLELLENFASSVSANGLKDFPIHLKIDTGMNRLGFKASVEFKKAIQFLQQCKALKIQSVFSHLAGSDEMALDDFTQEQFLKFENAANLVRESFPYPIDRHILNSAGIERFPEKQYEMVRLGIGLYGVSVTGLPLENIGTLKSTISQIKTVGKQESVGYNRKGKVDRESQIAVVPVGYADGIDRKLGNGNGKAWVNGKLVPLIGNICMDMLMLDVSEVDAQSSDTVEFFGPHISIETIAKQVGTIPYEILTGISQRVKRIYLQE